MNELAIFAVAIAWMLTAIFIGYRLGFIKSLIISLAGTALIFLSVEADKFPISWKLLSIFIFGPLLFGGILSIFFIYTLRLER